MRGYVFRLIPPRPSFAFDMSDEERATMMEHVAYWAALTEQGRALAYGPVDDAAGAYGIGIVLAEDDDEMAALRDGDPAVRSAYGLRAEVSPMLRLVTPEQTYGD
jgi:uncharacterized protein